VAYQGEVASQPLALYLRGLPWDPPSAAPVKVGEVDVIGNTWQTLARPLPSGVQLIAKKRVDNMLVDRFAVHPAWYLPPPEIGQRARALLGPAPAQPTVVVQRNDGAGR
jgi:hypothetical protein